MRGVKRLSVLGSFVVAILLLVGSTLLVSAGPSLQGAPDLETLLAAASAENVEWENISFWSDQVLGDSSLAALRLPYGTGDVFPDVVMTTLQDEELALADITGPVVVNFWASWCGPCRLELPLLVEAFEDTDAPFGVVLVNVWDAETDYRTFAEDEIPAGIPTGRVAEGVPESLGLRAIPVSVLLDANKTVQMVHVGNVTPAVMDLFYYFAGPDAPPPALDAPLVEVDPLPEGDSDTVTADLLASVERANRSLGAGTTWQGGVLGLEDVTRMTVRVGEKMPGFGLPARDGEAFRLDVAGEPYLLNFWAAWCGPCREEFPILIDADTDPANPYRVAFVNVWDDRYTADAFLVDYPGAATVVYDLRNELPDMLRMDFIPVSVLVDAQGTVLMVHSGPVNDAVLDFAAALVTEAEGAG